MFEGGEDVDELESEAESFGRQSFTYSH